MIYRPCKRLDEAIAALPVCSVSDVQYTADSNIVTFNLFKVLDTYFTLDYVDEDTPEVSEEEATVEQNCWFDFFADFETTFEFWVENQLKAMPKSLLDKFLRITKPCLIANIIGDTNSLFEFRIKGDDDGVYQIFYEGCLTVKEIAQKFKLEQILNYLPQEKKRIEANNIILVKKVGYAKIETPEAKQLRKKFAKELEKESKACFKELGQYLISSITSFLDKVPKIMAKRRLEYGLPDGL